LKAVRIEGFIGGGGGGGGGVRFEDVLDDA